MNTNELYVSFGGGDILYFRSISLVTYNRGGLKVCGAPKSAFSAGPQGAEKCDGMSLYVISVIIY
jgi:hypothetical protein